MPGTYPTEVDTAILTAINRYTYLTAVQLSRLRYPTLKDDGRYARRRLHALAEAGFLLRHSAFPTPQYGSAPFAFTLSRTGRAYLSEQGIGVPEYFRPNEQATAAANPIFMRHTLAVIDVLIAAERLTQDVPAVTMPRLRTERELRRSPLRVAPNPQRPERTVAVIPDAWMEVQVGSGVPIAIAVEVDRASEGQARWKAKVAALAAWAAGPYRQAFQATNLTIAVLTPDPARREVLRAWTGQELTHRGVGSLAELFLITAVCPVATPPEQLFFLPVWHQPRLTGRPTSQSRSTATRHQPGTRPPVSLLDPLPGQPLRETLFEGS